MTRGIHPNVNACAIARLWYSGRPALCMYFGVFDVTAKFCFGKRQSNKWRIFIRAEKYTGEVDLEMTKFLGEWGVKYNLIADKLKEKIWDFFQL